MVIGLQLPLQSQSLDAMPGKHMPMESETIQPLSFGELLKLKEKQLQGDLQVSASSIAAALMALQTQPMAVPLSTSPMEVPDIRPSLDGPSQPAVDSAGTSPTFFAAQPTTARLTTTEPAASVIQPFPGLQAEVASLQAVLPAVQRTHTATSSSAKAEAFDRQQGPGEGIETAGEATTPAATKNGADVTASQPAMEYVSRQANPSHSDLAATVKNVQPIPVASPTVESKLENKTQATSSQMRVNGSPIMQGGHQPAAAEPLPNTDTHVFAATEEDIHAGALRGVPGATRANGAGMIAEKNLTQPNEKQDTKEVFSKPVSNSLEAKSFVATEVEIPAAETGSQPITAKTSPVSAPAQNETTAFVAQSMPTTPQAPYIYKTVQVDASEHETDIEPRTTASQTNSPSPAQTVAREAAYVPSSPDATEPVTSRSASRSDVVMDGEQQTEMKYAASASGSREIEPASVEQTSETNEVVLEIASKASQAPGTVATHRTSQLKPLPRDATLPSQTTASAQELNDGQPVPGPKAAVKTVNIQPMETAIIELDDAEVVEDRFVSEKASAAFPYIHAETVPVDAARTARSPMKDTVETIVRGTQETSHQPPIVERSVIELSDETEDDMPAAQVLRDVRKAEMPKVSLDEKSVASNSEPVVAEVKREDVAVETVTATRKPTNGSAVVEEEFPTDEATNVSYGSTIKRKSDPLAASRPERDLSRTEESTSESTGEKRFAFSQGMDVPPADANTPLETTEAESRAAYSNMVTNTPIRSAEPQRIQKPASQPDMTGIQSLRSEARIVEPSTAQKSTGTNETVNPFQQAVGGVVHFQEDSVEGKADEPKPATTPSNVQQQAGVDQAPGKFRQSLAGALQMKEATLDVMVAVSHTDSGESVVEPSTSQPAKADQPQAMTDDGSVSSTPEIDGETAKPQLVETASENVKPAYQEKHLEAEKLSARSELVADETLQSMDDSVSVKVTDLKPIPIESGETLDTSWTATLEPSQVVPEDVFVSPQSEIRPEVVKSEPVESRPADEKVSEQTEKLTTRHVPTAEKDSPVVSDGNVSRKPVPQTEPQEEIQIQQIASREEEARPAERQPELNSMSGSTAPAASLVNEAKAVDLNGKIPVGQIHLHAAEVIQQVIRQMNGRIKSGASSMQLQLNPEELGAIEVDMVSTPQGMQVTFFAEQASTGRLLETQLNQLRDSLVDSGVQLSGLNIGHHNTQGQKGGAFRQDTNFAPLPPEIFVEESQAGAKEAPTLERSIGRASEVDYRI